MAAVAVTVALVASMVAVVLMNVAVVVVGETEVLLTFAWDSPTRLQPWPMLPVLSSLNTQASPPLPAPKGLVEPASMNPPSEVC